MGEGRSAPWLRLCQWRWCQVRLRLVDLLGSHFVEMTFSLALLLLMFSGQLCMLTKITNKCVHPISKKLFLMFWKLNIWAWVLPVWSGSVRVPLWVWTTSHCGERVCRFDSSDPWPFSVLTMFPFCVLQLPFYLWPLLIWCYSTLQPGNLKHTHDLANDWTKLKNPYFQDTYCPTSKVL